MITRRALLKGIIGAGAGLLLPEQSERRVWALDRTMLPGIQFGQAEAVVYDLDAIGVFDADGLLYAPMTYGELPYSMGDFTTPIVRLAFHVKQRVYAASLADDYERLTIERDYSLLT